MKQPIVITAALCLAACTTQPKPETSASRGSKAEPATLVHYHGVGFAFCTKDCPSATEKVLFLSLDMSSSDPKERVLARLRAQMLKQTGRAESSGTKVGVVPVESGGSAPGSGRVRDAWTIYALLGAATQPVIEAELRRIVSTAPGARFHLLASEAAQAEAQAYRNALTNLGVPRGDIGTFVLQAPVRSEAVIAAASATASGAGASSSPADKQLLVIRELARN
jgi:hypothetical protein